MATAIRPEQQQHDENGVNLDAVLEQTERGRAESESKIDLLRMRVSSIKRAKVDAVAETPALVASCVTADNAPKQVVIDMGPYRMQIGDVAHDQMAFRFKIDKRYYDRMRESAPELLAENLNWWFTHEPQERLLRMLRPDAFDVGDRKEMAAIGAHFRLRGLLGKGYRTIDDADFVDAIVPTLVENGANLVDFSIDERRMHAKFVTEVFTMDQIRELYAKRYGLTPAQMRQHRTIDGRDIAFVNEPMSFGMTIRHSEVGYASLAATQLVRIAKCTNDLVGENAIAIRHVGGKNGKAWDGTQTLGGAAVGGTAGAGGADDDVRDVSDATQLLDNAALLSRVQDTIKTQMDPKYALERANAIVMAKIENLPRPAGKPLFEFVGNVGLNLGLTQTETELLKEETQKSIIVEGGETRFAFIQGITAVARQMTNYERRIDTEHAGFQLLQDDASALVKLGRDAEKQQRTRKQ